MFEKSNIKSNSNLKRNTKEKMAINKPFVPSCVHHEKNTQKNIIMKSKTPTKAEKQKFSNNININKSTIIAPFNNNYNINNSITISINISMQKNQGNNKTHKSINEIQKKSNSKKNPINIKKDNLKNVNVKQTKRTDLMNKDIQSSNNALDVKKNKPNKNSFSLTVTGFYPKKREKNKNISLDNLKISENINQAKKDNTISTTVHKNNNKKIMDKNIILQKKRGNKKNNFSPEINRELLNIKQNEILNNLKDNKTVNNQKEENNKAKNENNNFKNISISPSVKNRKISIKNRSKSISNTPNEINIFIINLKKSYLFENLNKIQKSLIIFVQS